jgi:agmatinase
VNDDESGFQRIEAREIDTIGALSKDIEGKDGSILFPNAGTAGIIEKIRKTVGDRPVYLSIDVRRLFAGRNMLTQPVVPWG